MAVICPDLPEAIAAELEARARATLLTSDLSVSVTISCAGEAVAVQVDAGDDSVTLAEDAAATPIDVLADDTDVDGDPITVVAASNPSHGTVVVDGDGLGLTYEPDADYCGDDAFDYTIDDGEFESTADVDVTVTCVNDAPVAVDDEVSTDEDVDLEIAPSALLATGRRSASGR